jgi:hypothetical protein
MICLIIHDFKIQFAIATTHFIVNQKTSTNGQTKMVQGLPENTWEILNKQYKKLPYLFAYISVQADLGPRHPSSVSSPIADSFLVGKLQCME